MLYEIEVLKTNPIMSEKFLKFAEAEKLTKAQQKSVTGGEEPAEDESIHPRKGKVAAS